MLFITAVDLYIKRLEDHMHEKAKKWTAPEDTRSQQADVSTERLILNFFKKERAKFLVSRKTNKIQEFFEGNDAYERADFPKYRMKYGKTTVQFGLVWEKLILRNKAYLIKKMDEFFNTGKINIPLTHFKLLLLFRLQQQCIALRKAAHQRLIQIDIDKNKKLQEAQAALAAESSVSETAETSTLTPQLPAASSSLSSVTVHTGVRSEAETKQRSETSKADSKSKHSKQTQSKDKGGSSGKKGEAEAKEQSEHSKTGAAGSTKSSQSQSQTAADAKPQSNLAVATLVKPEQQAQSGSNSSDSEEDEDEGDEEDLTSDSDTDVDSESLKQVVSQLRRTQISTLGEVDRKSREIPPNRKHPSSDLTLLNALLEKIEEAVELMRLFEAKATTAVGNKLAITPSDGETGEILFGFKSTMGYIFDFYSDADARSNLLPGAEQACIDCSPEKIRKKEDPLLIAYEGTVEYLMTNFSRLSENDQARSQFSGSIYNSVLNILTTNPITTIQKGLNVVTFSPEMSAQKRTELLNLILDMRTRSLSATPLTMDGKINQGYWRNMQACIKDGAEKASHMGASLSIWPQEFTQYYKVTQARMKTLENALIEKHRIEADARKPGASTTSRTNRSTAVQ